MLSVFFPLQNAVCFIILTYLVPVLLTFYIQVVLKFKKNNSGAKKLIFVKGVRNTKFPQLASQKVNLISSVITG
jgi:hypothetical protein